MNPILEEKGRRFAERYAKYILTALGFTEEEAKKIVERMRGRLEELAKRWAEEWERSMVKLGEVV